MSAEGVSDRLTPPLALALAGQLRGTPGLVASPTTHVFHMEDCPHARGLRHSAVVPLYRLPLIYVANLRPCGNCKPSQALVP